MLIQSRQLEGSALIDEERVESEVKSEIIDNFSSGFLQGSAIVIPEKKQEVLQGAKKGKNKKRKDVEKVVSI